MIVPESRSELNHVNENSQKLHCLLESWIFTDLRQELVKTSLNLIRNSKKIYNGESIVTSISVLESGPKNAEFHP